ncbi:MULTISPECIES: cation diffusion facilitator family transporter [Lysinibacillus]|uniref:cation diffusion facilitator family transporter n=1 Tax=Lysinibacillus TaxID=400634 RepID=UPI0021A58943|nr:cation diffusion facilitator family transporter [Lysinibacillus capsici]MCT1542061.1 cation diffusion facilitator family transporter [Lysinibacillus capsici]MCT1573297.1 cation diffusion facilitator family transporter [Lysinibacillus capsici]MCT1650308.1 cation diffusion facilitator family transporter [Lysinibacillus capsici]MCT1728697.1 cation diffusion facilitator family transporter [Lysinibacillus capsici]MCT1786479.1 cation diffusion facilitator family transporter [Lysinibacillus capsic
MGHQHDHGHDHTHGANKKVLLLSFIIITGYMVVEAIGGFLTNSLALLSDAGHMLSDSISLGIAMLAFMFGEKAASYSKTYGYKRFEILAAVLNGITLIGIALFIFYEAIERFTNPPEVATTGMLIISIIGLFINILVAWIMMRGSDTKDNLNMRGAFLHVLSDMLGSVGAIVAALLIMFFGWGWADPLASVIVALLVVRSGYHVTKASIHVLMEGTPSNVDVQEIIQLIEQTDGIESIHDLHIWTITSGTNALSCHAVVNDQLKIAESEHILRKIEHNLQHKGIKHVTIQLETSLHRHDNSILCKLENDHEHHHDDK